MPPFYVEGDRKLSNQMAFWVPPLLLITIWNLHPFEERVKHFFQEGPNEISLYQFFKKNRWGGLTSSPTTLQSKITLRGSDY